MVAKLDEMDLPQLEVSLGLHHGVQLLVKTFLVSEDTDPQTLVEKDLSRRGVAYEATDILRQEQAIIGGSSFLRLNGVPVQDQCPGKTIYPVVHPHCQRSGEQRGTLFVPGHSSLHRDRLGE